MSNEIIRISNIASKNKQIDTVMYALNKENLKQSAKKIAGNKAVGIDKVTNAIYEPMFKNFSFGFRPNRSCHQAIAYLDKMIHR